MQDLERQTALRMRAEPVIDWLTELEIGLRRKGDVDSVDW